MIRSCLYIIDIQKLGDFFYLFTAEAIYDARFPLIGLYKLYELLLSLMFWPHFIIEVLSVERRFKDISCLHLQVLLNIELHFRRSCSRQGNDRQIANLSNNRLYFPIFWPKIMAPFGNTMCFINDEKGAIGLFQNLNIILLCQSLGGTVQPFNFSIHRLLFHLVHFCLCER